MSVALLVKVKNLEMEVLLLKEQVNAFRAQLSELNDRVVPAVVHRRKSRESAEQEGFV